MDENAANVNLTVTSSEGEVPDHIVAVSTIVNFNSDDDLDIYLDVANVDELEDIATLLEMVVRAIRNADV